MCFLRSHFDQVLQDSCDLSIMYADVEKNGGPINKISDFYSSPNFPNVVSVQQKDPPKIIHSSFSCLHLLK